MIDSHCHLDHEKIIMDIEQILKKCKKAGLKKLLTICTTDLGFNNILKLVNKDPIIFGTYGIHPHETANHDISKDIIIKRVKTDNKIIGVGESGLDFYYNNSDKLSQIKSFSSHIEASIEMRIPIIIHSRNAENETLDILSNYKNLEPKILMHCFTGSAQFAKKLLDLNSYFSASGIITFKKSNELQNTFKNIPTENLLVETDSPYLAPDPHRGKINDPSLIIHTLKKLSEIKNLDINELEIITSKNFNKLFS